jgi:hypothetical protein
MRQIDRKFHIDGEQIIKTSNGQPLPDGEPRILFRARDYLALPMLRHYRQLSVDDGCTDYHLTGIDAVIADFEAFAKLAPDAMKQPGITKGR